MPENSSSYMDSIRAFAGSNPHASIRQMLTQQLGTDIYHTMHAALQQRLPAGTKYERIEPKTLTKFEVGAD